MMFDHLLIDAAGPLVWTVYSDVLLLSAVVAVSGFALAFALALAFSFASFVLVTRQSFLSPRRSSAPHRSL